MQNGGSRFWIPSGVWDLMLTLRKGCDREDAEKRSVCKGSKEDEELQRMQLEERVFATVRGGRYHKDTCGDLRKARMSNPQGIVELSRQESQRCGYTACGNRGG